MIRILTSKNWQSIEEELHLCDTLEGHGCCDCGEQATKVVDKGSAANEFLWAMCDDCAFESDCDSKASAHYEDYMY